MRISTEMMHRSALQGMLEQQASLNETQLQISSGKKIQSAADDPAGASMTLMLSQVLAKGEQFQENAGLASDRLRQEEDTLSHINKVLDRVRELTLQGNNSTLGPRDRQMLVAEMRQRLDEVLGFANTRDPEGDFLFAGFQSRQQPFSLSGSGVVSYLGDDGQRMVDIGENRSVAVTDSGNRVFRGVPSGNGSFVTSVSPTNTGSGIITAGRVVDAAAYQGGSYQLSFTANDTFEVRDAGGNLVLTEKYVSGADVSFAGIQFGLSGKPSTGDQFDIVPGGRTDIFSILNNVMTALTSGAENPSGRAERASKLGRSIADLDQALERVRSVQAEVGARLNTIDSQQDVNSGQSLQLKQTISGLNDLDYADAITKLNRYMVGLQAAQQSYSRIQGLSLFNYL